MSKKLINRVNGGIAIYYGIGSIMGAISGVIGISIWIFKVFNGQTNFSWGTLIALTIITSALGVIGYSIVRVGYEEIER